MSVDSEDIKKCMESVFDLHSRLMKSGLSLPMKQAELIYDLTESKIEPENIRPDDVHRYLDQLAIIEGENLKKNRIVKVLNEIKSVTAWDLEREMIDQFLHSSVNSNGVGIQENLKNIFSLDISWEDIEKLFNDLERTAGKSSLLGRILDIFGFEYFLDYLGNDVLQDKIFFDEEVHIRYSNRASEYQNGRIVEVLQRGIKEQRTGRVIRKATVVTSFRA